MTHDLKPYPEYKDSGVPWLGEIPAHWDVRPLRAILKQRNEKNNPIKTTQILSLSIAHGVTLYSHEGRGGNKSKGDLAAYKIAHAGDIVLNSMNVIVGAVGLSKYTGAISPVYYALYPRTGNVDINYYDKVFSNSVFQRYLLIYGKGILIKKSDSGKLNTIRMKISSDDLNKTPLAVPTTEEQSKIARFLDWKSSQINKFIRNRQRLIEVLNEQKQAIINRAVTRGLDPNVKLKPSGVEWLGDIPEHWLIKPLKHWADINKRVLSETTDPDYTFEYLDIGCVGTGILVEKPVRISFGDAPSRARRIIQAGDTIISTVRTYLRAVYFVACKADDLIASTGFAVLTPKQGIMPEYLGIALQSDPFIDRVAAHSIGIAYPAITETRLGAFHVPVPPSVDEQAAIVACIRRETEAFEKGIQYAQREIDLIREYWTRLIADAVTGKVDVREIAAEQRKPAKVIQFPKKKEQAGPKANVHFRRAVFAAEIVARLHREPTFGHVKFQKLIFLCEKKCSVDIGSTYYRQAAGPYDNRALRSIDSQMRKQKWYASQMVEGRYHYVPLPKAGGHKTYFARYFSDIEKEFSNIIETFRKVDTERCGIVATLYSAWEDLLKENGRVSDDRIVHEVLTNWHESKKRIPRECWENALKWMRQHGFVPGTMRQSGKTS